MRWWPSSVAGSRSSPRCKMKCCAVRLPNTRSQRRAYAAAGLSVMELTNRAVLDTA